MLRVCVQVLGEKAEKFTMFGDHGTVESYDSSDVTQRHQHTNRQSLCSTKPRINPALTSEQGSVTKGKRIQADRKVSWGEVGLFHNSFRSSGEDGSTGVLCRAGLGPRRAQKTEPVDLLRCWGVGRCRAN